MQVAEPLHYKPEGCTVDSRLCLLLSPFGRSMALGSTETLREITVFPEE